jgi:hypothetical protein
MLFGLGLPEWLAIIGLLGGLVLTFYVMARASVAYEAKRQRREAGSAGSQSKREAGSAGSQSKREAGSAGSQSKREAGSAGSQSKIAQENQSSEEESGT